MKNAKKLFLLVLAIGALSGCAPSSSTDSFYLKELDIYVPNILTGYAPAKTGTMKCGFSPEYGEEEAYFPLDGLLSHLVTLAEMKGSFSRTSSDSVSVSYGYSSGNQLAFTVNAETDTVYFSDYMAYLSLDSSHVGDSSNLSTMKGLVVLDDGYRYESGGAYTFDLSSYDIDIVMHEGDVYIPGLAARAIFTEPLHVPFVYNGNAVYCPPSGNLVYDDSSEKLTGFGEAYYSSPFSEQERKGESVAKLHGDEAMFYLDHFYGFQDDEKYNGGKVSEYLKTNYPSQYALFYSADKEASEEGWDWLINTYMADLHGSTNDNHGSLYAGYDFSSSAEYGQRIKDDLARSAELTSLRKEKLGIPETGLRESDMFAISGDMAVIRFDSFDHSDLVATSGNAEYYGASIASDLYALMAYSFMKIEENGGIKKVVIDLTLNGGGAEPACLEGFSFLSDVTSFDYYHVLTKTSVSLPFKGKLPNGRTSSYGKDYDIYVMTSLCSFSCGNLFPTFAKKSGIKVIGEKSGGGACTVGNFYSPDGQLLNISSIKRLSLTTGKEHNDGGIEPDIALDSSYFYDLPKLSARLDEVSAN